MKVLLLGSNGQLGWELQRTCPDSVSLTLYDYPKVDFLSSDSISQCIQTIRPEFIINAAAYTNVDKAEQERELAQKINHEAVVKIAEHCKQLKIFLVHISTDFIFNGKSHRPYMPEDTPNPISVYGESKLQGERAALSILKDQTLIIRTAWLYSSHGNNFVKTMLKLMKIKPELSIIDEQVGTPTWAYGFAKAIWKAMDKKLKGIYHWTDAGVASWYDFAVAIQEESIREGLLDTPIPIHPIPSSKYPVPAKRPIYSVLDKTSFWHALHEYPPHWRAQLQAMLKKLVQ
ncbi:MAG: dTDP-4-dehydrorhamnose reductase [Desulfobacteraceae bacterium]|nr:dTDP-4-dehydrorhamnose reductase [Desulfobacteraceae bacterium]